ncbi:MAG: hypothetical protein KAS04_03295 [Candidatus Aenigmarchaeota archaeon]|nr:hypothetical protein [Candidatus Aenigmarchaeota archaeon]
MDNSNVIVFIGKTQGGYHIANIAHPKEYFGSINKSLLFAMNDWLSSFDKSERSAKKYVKDTLNDMRVPKEIIKFKRYDL